MFATEVWQHATYSNKIIKYHLPSGGVLTDTSADFPPGTPLL